MCILLFIKRYLALCIFLRSEPVRGVCEENSVNNQIFYDNEMAEGSC